MNLYKKSFKPLKYKYLDILTIATSIVLFNLYFILNYSFLSDNSAYFIPHYHFITESLKKGDIPYWFPYNFTGLPEIFKPELAIFNPFTIILLISNYTINHNLDISITGNLREIVNMCSQIFGSIGMYFLCKNYFFKDKKINIFISVLFSLSPFAGHLPNTTVILGFVALPWIVLFLMRLIDQSTRKNFFILTFFNFLLFTSGYVYYYVYFIIFQLIITFFFNYKKIFYVIASYIMAITLSLFFLLPNYHIINLSNRSDNITDHKIYSLKITKIIQLLNPLPNGFSYSELDPKDEFSLPTITLGSSSFLILLLGTFFYKKDRKYLFLVISFFLFLVYSSIGYILPSEVINQIPIVNKFRSHSQGFVISYFTMVILAGRGLEIAKTINNSSYLKSIVRISSVAFALAGLLLLYNNLNNIVITSWIRSLLVMSLSSICLLLISRKNNIGIYILFLLMFCELFYVYGQFKSHVLVKTSYRDYFAANSLILPEMKNNLRERVYFFNNQFGYNTSHLNIEQFSGYEALPYKAWYDFGYRYGHIEHLKKLNVRYIVSTDSSYSKENGFKLIEKVYGDKKFSQNIFSSIESLPYPSIHSKNNHYIYEILDPVPRFFATTKITPCKEEGCIKQEDFPNKLIYNGDLNTIFTSNDKVKINNLNKQSSEIEMDILSPTHNFIGSSEIYDPGWSLYINENKKDIYKISTGFIGFFVDSGKNQVYLRYFPQGLKLGATLSIFFLFLFICIFIYWNKAKIIVKFTNDYVK